MLSHSDLHTVNPMKMTSWGHPGNSIQQIRTYFHFEKLLSITGKVFFAKSQGLSHTQNTTSFPREKGFLCLSMEVSLDTVGTFLAPHQNSRVTNQSIYNRPVEATIHTRADDTADSRGQATRDPRGPTSRSASDVWLTLRGEVVDFF